MAACEHFVFLLSPAVPAVVPPAGAKVRVGNGINVLEMG